MPLDINNQIIAPDIHSISVLKPGVVYLLGGVATLHKLVVKFEQGDVNRFKMQKKFVNVLDPGNVKLRIAKNAELQAIDTKLIVPPVWRTGTIPGGVAPPPPATPPIVQALSVPFRNGPRTQLGVLRELIADALANRGFAVKMAYNAGLKDAEGMDANPFRTAAFRKVFFEVNLPVLVQAAWEKLGRIAAVDLFIGNCDRFDIKVPQVPYQAIRNLGNHMYLGNEPIGLDTWDPATHGTTIGDLNTPVAGQDLTDWSGPVLQGSNSAARDAFATKVVQDYLTLAKLVTPPLPAATYEGFFKTGLMNGRQAILNKIQAIATKHHGGILGNLSAGLQYRYNVLQN